MKIAAIIPARYHSTRFEAKPLAKIAGFSMIERVYRRVRRAIAPADIYVATDDRRILNEVERFAGQAVLTAPGHQSGTDRLWEVLSASDYDAALNIQGDEPLISPVLVQQLRDALADGEYPVMTAAFKSHSPRDYLSEHVVKVVLNCKREALYFSRSPLPNIRKPQAVEFLQHVGIYAYTRAALEKFISSPPAQLEKRESLEQLRFLELGIPIQVLITDYVSQPVDVPEDIAKIEEMLRGQHGEE